MTQILRNKNLATKLQILVEIAANQPNIQQKDVARKLQITPQAVSQYIEGLVKEGLLATEGRSKYRITNQGVDQVLRALRELQSYCTFVREAVTNITVCAAVADCDLSRGQAVGLKMKDGLLFATKKVGAGARGVAIADARKGEDVGITNIEGLVELGIGKITILKIPGVQRGGSRGVDLARLKQELDKPNPVGTIGIEALVAVRRGGVEPHYVYGVAEAAIEAAHSGLAFTIVCTDEELPGLLRRLETERLGYEVLDLKANTNRR